ncbi:thiol-disulfide isomerase/thioredoxin [Povalibacter uvarum]|uniref:Thiol-disulfide isomerase/thioredoxin n=1 Tax=Povalibacter uvarum TaxID=732238 RepID=A0A841HIN7_9GAMM|nr:TlpA disulfide reductase family protein [Povalibacter uvarum]MBB6092877.1 thiol-disulfide isomerase/thioredoxin [Povalibacter uvarum]
MSRHQTSRVTSIFALALLTVATIGGCSSRVSEPVAGRYRAVLELPGGDAPFGLDIAREDEKTVLYLSNGTERTRVANVTVHDGELSAVFPGYENTLRAKVSRDALDGNVTLIKAGGVEQVIPFRAKLNETWRFYPESLTDNPDVAGRWEVTLTDSEGKATKAVALLEQSHDRVSGTVMTPTGDHRFLDGQIHGNELQLSTFAGGLAYLYKLQVVDGALQGDYWQGLKSHEQVAASRNDNAELEHIETTLKSDDRFNFTFKDVDGNDVALNDERFRGKVVVVTLGGTWCPNCHDEAAFLVPYYREIEAQGFEVIALMFERHGEFEKAATAVRGFRRDLGIPYTTLIAGVADDEDPERKLPTLSGVYGYPTAIFVDRTGHIRKIHTGFSGPATGKHYDEQIADFKALVEQLLKEPATAS